MDFTRFYPIMWYYAHYQGYYQTIYITIKGVLIGVGINPKSYLKSLKINDL